jgi:uncharacterized membrane protein
MSDHIVPAQPKSDGRLTRALIVCAIVIAVIGVSAGPSGLRDILARFQEGRLHAPNLALIAAAPLIVQLHLATVLVGFAIGAVQMLGAKGTAMHRAMGWTFVAFLTFTALDALLIKNGPVWTPNPIQLFSLMALTALPIGVIAARRHNVAAHARTMTGLFWGGLMLAGLLTFIPGRLMWRVFFG